MPRKNSKPLWPWIVSGVLLLALMSSIVIKSLPSSSVMDTSDWQVYENKEWGFRLRHPKELSVHISEERMGNRGYFNLDIGTSEDVWLRMQSNPGSGGPPYLFRLNVSYLSDFVPQSASALDLHPEERVIDGPKDILFGCAPQKARMIAGEIGVQCGPNTPGSMFKDAIELAVFEPPETTPTSSRRLFIFSSFQYSLDKSPVIDAILDSFDFLSERNTVINPTRIQQKFSSIETHLLGRVTKVSTVDGKTIAQLTLLENVDGQENMENAAIADGVCTLEQVEKDECFNNPFYIRDTGTSLDLEIDPQADIQIYAREPRGGMLVDVQSRTYFEQEPLEQFVEIFTQDNPPHYLKKTPFYFGIEGGKIVQIQEKYQP